MTHDEFEVLWLDALRVDADDTVNLLGNPRTHERERRTCAAFLRCAGIEFTPDQVIASTTEPPDVLFGLVLFGLVLFGLVLFGLVLFGLVLFGLARFEIAIVLPQQRKMQDEWAATAKRRARAQNIKDLIEPYHPPETLTRQQVVDLIMPMADKKARKYSARGVPCAELDLLLYVNQNLALNAGSPNPPCTALVCQGWRSVSLLIPPHSYVVLADNAAPEFIFRSAEKPTAAWTRPGQIGMFDI